jgi:hypothetical protein
MPRRPSGRILETSMCFGALTTCEPCETCGRRHPAGPKETCIELVARDETGRLESELGGYLESPEAQFFGWLASRSRG